ncbi:ABC transporter, permease protein [Clostridium botulinum C str. Eklund]|nr:ABC transporter, permease protein [Clostridium botulinum C str. Eklund]
MNFLKRAMLSIKKKKMKSLMLFMVLFIVANMVLVGLSIESATKKSTELAREKLGSDVTLKVNQRKIMEERRANGDKEKGNMPYLTTTIADTLKDNSHVIAYNYSSSSFGLSKDFNNVKSENTDESDSSKSEVGRRPMFGMQGNSNVTTMPEVSFLGTLTTNLLDEFKNGDVKILEGRGITKDDTGKNVALIETNLAKENNLKVGSKITISSLDKKKDVNLEIVGIYEANSDVDTGHNRNMDFLNPYNKIYMPYNVASQFSNNEESNGKDITSATYFMDSAENIDSFKEYAKSKKIDLDTYTLDANDVLYKQMVGPIENVGSFSKTLVLGVTIAGAVILILIIALSLKDRKYEIGVLLSLGESKGKIISQLIVEVLLVAIIAFGSSAFTGNLGGKK